MRKDRADTTNGIGGGLLIYSKYGLKILPTNKHADCGFNQFTEFSVMTKGEPMNFVLFYRPPASGGENIDNLCKIMRNADKNTMLIGDLNLPGINWAEETTAGRKERSILDAAEESDLSQLVNFATHRKGNLLDVVLTNCSEKILSVTDVGVLGRSDHCIIAVDIVAYPVTNLVRVRKPNWKKADRVGIKTILKRKTGTH